MKPVACLVLFDTPQSPNGRRACSLGSSFVWPLAGASGASEGGTLSGLDRDRGRTRAGGLLQTTRLRVQQPTGIVLGSGLVSWSWWVQVPLRDRSANPGGNRLYPALSHTNGWRLCFVSDVLHVRMRARGGTHSPELSALGLLCAISWAG